MASPGMMTGFILAMARAAGEVAPLMLTGAVKNAPVPLDGSFPFLHPDRQFMHLGFHILDISCKSPNVEATKPMVYVTTLLLLFIVLTMSSLAIYLRNRMRKTISDQELCERADMAIARMHSETRNCPVRKTDHEHLPMNAITADRDPGRQRPIEGAAGRRRRIRRTSSRRSAIRSCGRSNLHLYYGKSEALTDITMDFPRHEVTALIGPSGCGKSTFLRCLNRMNDLIDDVRTTGSIEFDGQDITDPALDVIELRRRVGMVFQKPTPFPKSIYENVAYGMRIAGYRQKSALDEIVEKSLRRAALWDEVKDRLHDSALGLLRRAAPAAVHRADHRRQSRNHPHGRALFGPRSAIDHADRRPDRRIARRVHDHHRHPQHAAGRPRFRLDGVPLRRRADRIRLDQAAFHQAAEERDRRLHYGEVWMIEDRYEDDECRMNAGRG